MPRFASRLCSGIASSAIVVTSLVLASPAHAAPVLDLQAASTTVTAGQPVELSWTSTDVDPDASAVPLTASGDWPENGTKDPNGSEDVPTTAPGSLTFVLTADDGDPSTDDPTSDVTVTVTAATEVTPTAPVAEGCSFTIPDVTGVTYAAVIDDEPVELGPDSYPSFVFAGADDVVSITAAADAGFVLAGGAQTTFTIDVSDDCLDGGVVDVLDVSAACESVTFTNTSDIALNVAYGDAELDGPTGQLALAAGESQKVKSRSSSVGYLAFPEYFDSVDDFFETLEAAEDINTVISLLSTAQFGDIDVPQDCTTSTASSHPTVAPAAGL